MKILFSADWHIKVGQKNVPREWQINRYKQLFEKLWALENFAIMLSRATKPTNYKILHIETRKRLIVQPHEQCKSL